VTDLRAMPVLPNNAQSLRDALAEARLPAAEFGPEARYHRYVDQSGGTIGFGGVEGAKADRLLRSVVVLPEFRGSGLGGAIVRDLEKLAVEAGCSRLHLLTTTAAPFFEQLGYEPRNRMTAPIEISLTTEFSTLCPASARYLVKSLA
jgi:amino-acid N-acetyltransferase